MCSSMLLLKFFVYSKEDSANSEHKDQKMRQVVAYKGLKTKENYILNLLFQAQKVVAVAYRRWSFTRGSNCKAFTGKGLVFWMSGRLQEVVAYERWSHREVRL